MIECKRILAVVDAERDNQPALSRAYELASKTGASVTAMMVVYDLSYDMTTMLSPDERESMRDAVTKEHAKWLATHLREQGFTETDIVVEWNNRAYESIIYYTLNNQIDLVVKATKKHDDLASVLAVLSGDTQQNVNALTAPLPISTAKGGLTPEQKYEAVQAMQQSGAKVMMMGDGINDAPVLASADVAIAVGNATDVAKTAADVILLGDQLLSVPELIRTAHQVKQKIRQNIGWSVGYNVLILPFAVSGLLSPWMAVVGMSLSSIIVVTNSTRLLLM